MFCCVSVMRNPHNHYYSVRAFAARERGLKREREARRSIQVLQLFELNFCFRFGVPVWEFFVVGERIIGCLCKSWERRHSRWRGPFSTVANTPWIKEGTGTTSWGKDKTVLTYRRCVPRLSYLFLVFRSISFPSHDPSVYCPADMPRTCRPR